MRGAPKGLCEPQRNVPGESLPPRPPLHTPAPTIPPLTISTKSTDSNAELPTTGPSVRAPISSGPQRATQPSPGHAQGRDGATTSSFRPNSSRHHAPSVHVRPVASRPARDKPAALVTAPDLQANRKAPGFARERRPEGACPQLCPREARREAFSRPLSAEAPRAETRRRRVPRPGSRPTRRPTPLGR